MPTRRVIDDELYAHFVTFSVDRRRRLLDHDAAKRVVLGVLCKQLHDFAAKCVGFVIMPNHVHAIVWLPAIGQLSRFMHGWKRMSSFYVREWYRRCAPNYFEGFGEGNRFWQPKYHSFEIYGHQKLEQKLRYMHENPVRAGLVPVAGEWRWSSARWYDCGRSVGVKIDWLG